jgi:hypothetical protein
MATPTVDMSNPRKNPQEVYDSQVLFGSIPVAGSASSVFDISGWTQFALQINPGNGTVAGTTIGTVLTIYAAQDQQNTYSSVYGTTGGIASTIQFGSTTQQTITKIDTLQPLRFVKFVMGGTQSQAIGLSLIVK